MTPQEFEDIRAAWSELVAAVTAEEELRLHRSLDVASDSRGLVGRYYAASLLSGCIQRIAQRLWPAYARTFIESLPQADRAAAREAGFDDFMRCMQSAAAVIEARLGERR